MKHETPPRFPVESETFEWKQSLGEWKEIVETCAAFSTVRGGTIYVGVTPEGDYAGVRIGKGAIEDLANKIKLNTDPPIFPGIHLEGPESAALILIQVAESPVKPVWAFGRPLKRVGRTNQNLRREEAHRLMEANVGRTWDALVCDKCTSRDIDKKVVREYLNRTGMKESTPLGDLLKNVRMHSDSGYTNAAVLLFGKCPQEFIGEAQVKCARFRGVDSVDFLDERTFEGSILQQLEDAITFIARNTGRAIRITGRPAHDVVPEYPEEAIRETVINALCHRNYAEVGAIQIRIHDDRLEVWNPGHLPYDLTIQKLYLQHASRPRNPLIAHALYRARYIEQWGTGTLRIIQACEAHGLVAEFQMDMGMFIVRLKKPEKQDDVADRTESKAESKAESRAESGPELRAKSEVPQRVLLSLMKNPRSSRQIAASLGHTAVSGALKRTLNDLLKRGLIERTIPDKPQSRLQQYRLTSRGRKQMGTRHE